jgi:hypothetical protein
MTIKQNRPAAEPTLKDLMDLQYKNILNAVNCHAIGTIQSFNSTAQTVTATINYKKTTLQANALGVYGPVLIDYPILVDVPAVILQGGPTYLTFPIAKGDNCLILFNDKDIDNWFSSGQIMAVATQRSHSFSDGIALIGIRPMTNPLLNYDTTRAVLGNGQTVVGVGPTLIKLNNAAGNSLGSLLQTLITQIQNLVNATAAITVLGVTSGTQTSGVPANAAIISAIGTQLTTLATELSGLLE